MAIELTTLLQHANSVGVDQADNAKIFIREQGDISDKSGLGFFKRHFSSSARAAENRATVQAFQQAIAAHPQYAAFLENEQVARFFQDKQTQGTPLTARDVQQVKVMLGMAHADGVGQDLTARGLIPHLDATGFAWFCVGNNFSLDSPEDTKNALKAYYTSQHCDVEARNALSAAGVQPGKLEAALTLLKASEAWSSALDDAFAGDLDELTHTMIMDRFSDALGGASVLLGEMCSRDTFDSSFLRDMASPRNPMGLPLFNGTLEAVGARAITTEEAPLFIIASHMEQFDFSTPELRTAAIRKYRIAVDSEKIFTDMALANGLPAAAGKSLAYNPEFTAKATRALSEAFPPPAIPTRQQIAEVIDSTAAIFLVEKNSAIRSLLALPETSEGFAPALAEIVGALDERTICELLNPLLAGTAVLDRMMDPDAGIDTQMLEQLESFQAAVDSCQHTVTGAFGSEEQIAATRKSLAILMGARGADEEASGVLLANVVKRFSVIGPELGSVDTEVRTRQVTNPNFKTALQGVNFVQRALSQITQFAHSTTSAAHREALGAPEDADAFVSDLEQGPGGGTLPLHDIHRSVRVFALARGTEFPPVSYEGIREQSMRESQAFTGTSERPEVTALLRERAGAIAAEIGLTPFSPNDLDPVTLGARIMREVQGTGDVPASPGGARELAEAVIREHLQELKPAIDFIAGLPTEADPAVPGQFVVTPEEKQSLLRTIPGTVVRDPVLIKAVMLEARTLASPLAQLATPGMTVADMAAPVMAISSRHMNMLRSLQEQGFTSDTTYSGYIAALTLAVDAAHVTPGQTKEFYEAISGPQGIMLGRSLVGMASAYKLSRASIPDAYLKAGYLLGGLAGMDNLRLLLGARAGVAVEENPFYYHRGEDMGVQDIPGPVFTAMARELGFRSTDFPGYAALSMVAPKLTHPQWKTLQPVLRMVGESIPDHFDHDLALKMTAANARELLAAAEENPGTPLSPGQIWRAVLGDDAPEDVTADTLGARMYETATARMLERVQGAFPDATMETTGFSIKQSLGQGIPFRTLHNACQPGGQLGLEDMRFDAPILPSLAGYDAGNAYGLVADWGRRGASSDGTPSMMTIETGSGSGFAIVHHPIPDQENVADNPTFTAIMKHCRSACSSDIQFQRVMQCLSRAGAENLRLLAETFPGMTLREDSHFDSTVSPKPDGSVVVTLANGAQDRPFGAHIQITVTPAGEATVSDIGVTLRG